MSWSPNGNSLIIWSEEALGKVLPNYGFKTDNFAAFQRQLNYYGFRKVAQGKPTHYAHECFYRGSQRLNDIKKRVGQRQKTVPSPVYIPSSTPEPVSFPVTHVPVFHVPVPVPDIPVIDLSDPAVVHKIIKQSTPSQPLSIEDEVRQLRTQQQTTQSMMMKMLGQLQKNREETESLKVLVQELMEVVRPSEKQEETSEEQTETIEIQEDISSVAEQIYSEEQPQMISLNIPFEGFHYDVQDFCVQEQPMEDLNTPFEPEYTLDPEIEASLGLNCSADIDKLDKWINSLDINA
jgi:hypothetical protein